MTRLHVTYPDGETAEATYGASLEEMIQLYDDYRGCDGNPAAEEIDEDEWDFETTEYGGEC